MKMSRDQYVNLRPVRLMPGVKSPLAGKKPGDIDYYVVRENTEGEYSSLGGRLFEGTDREMAQQISTFTRKGVDRIMNFAFELAMTRNKNLVSATKSNGISLNQKLHKWRRDCNRPSDRHFFCVAR